MTFDEMITLLGTTEAQLNKAIEQVSNKLSVPPILLGVTATNVTMYGLCNTPVMINGTLHYIKEVIDVFAETRVFDPTEIETDLEEVQTVDISQVPVAPIGSVYYSNNYFSASEASFNITAYIKPRDYYDRGVRTIPTFMVLPVMSMARAIMKFDQNDILGHSQYQDIAYKLINYMNVSIAKIMPRGWGLLGELESYDV